jgi:hypothetical protein
VRLAKLRVSDPSAKLHQAQRDIAREYGFNSWRALKAQVDASGLDGWIIAAANGGNAEELGRLLAGQPQKIPSPAVNGSPPPASGRRQ